MIAENDTPDIDEKEEVKYLKHYTQLATLLNFLENKTIFLGNPANWGDKNDAASVEAYRRKRNVKEIRVLCFAYGLEMVHHWFTYAHGKNGCPYECEKEYRVIWTGDNAKQAPSISIEGCIEHITLSPGFCPYSAKAVGGLLMEKYSITTKCSRILESKNWIRLFSNLK